MDKLIFLLSMIFVHSVSYAGVINHRSCVMRGQTIAVTWQKGALNIEINAKALDKGDEGDVIRLRNLKSNVEFRGRIVRGKVYALTGGEM